jgi:AraC family transcriptional regulator, 4-hydroxyphenylacetate 3-monooxygenase operon regulatory protein
MRAHVPIYREEQKIYHADTCEPLIRAAKAGKLRLQGYARGAYAGWRLPETCLPQLRNLAFWDAPDLQDWGLDWHRNEGLELTYLESGKLPFAAGGQTHHLRGGDMTITRPWQPHQVGDPFVAASRLHWLILDLGVRRPNQPWKWPSWVVLTQKDLDELTILLRHNEQPVWSASANVQQCFERISRALESDREGSHVSRVTAYLNELLVSVLEMLRHNEISLDPSLSSTARTVELFLGDLRDNAELLGQQWTLKSMAEHCGLAETRFRYYCRQLTNMTPTQFAERCRIEAACRMLRHERKKSVTEVAMACGFGSSQYFATVFRRHRGCSPKDYREGRPVRPAAEPGCSKSRTDETW